MLCEECGQRDATAVLKIIKGTEQTERHLCQECLEKARKDLQRQAQDSIRNILNRILLQQGRTEPESSSNAENQKSAPLIPPDQDMICSGCGKRLSQVFRSMVNPVFGCPQCCRDFKPYLLGKPICPLYTGRKPVHTMQEQYRSTRCAELESLLQSAVEREDYEYAATLRDEIRQLYDGGQNT